MLFGPLQSSVTPVLSEFVSLRGRCSPSARLTDQIRSSSENVELPSFAAHTKSATWLVRSTENCLQIVVFATTDVCRRARFLVGMRASFRERALRCPLHVGVRLWLLITYITALDSLKFKEGPDPVGVEERGHAVPVLLPLLLARLPHLWSQFLYRGRHRSSSKGKNVWSAGLQTRPNGAQGQPQWPVRGRRGVTLSTR